MFVLGADLLSSLSFSLTSVKDEHGRLWEVVGGVSSKSGTRPVGAMPTRGVWGSRSRSQIRCQDEGARDIVMDRRQSSGMEGESQETRVWTLCWGADPFRKSSCVRKQLHGVRVTWPGMDTPEPRFMAKGHWQYWAWPWASRGDIVQVGEGKAAMMNPGPQGGLVRC